MSCRRVSRVGGSRGPTVLTGPTKVSRRFLGAPWNFENVLRGEFGDPKTILRGRFLARGFLSLDVADPSRIARDSLLCEQQVRNTSTSAWSHTHTFVMKKLRVEKRNRDEKTQSREKNSISRRTTRTIKQQKLKTEKIEKISRRFREDFEKISRRFREGFEKSSRRF